VSAHLLHIDESLVSWEETLQSSPSEWTLQQNDSSEAMPPDSEGPARERETHSAPGFPSSDLDGKLEPYSLPRHSLTSVR
jgi:hypothetical protein